MVEELVLETLLGADGDISEEDPGFLKGVSTGYRGDNFLVSVIQL